MLLTLAAAVCLALPASQQVEDPARLVPPGTLVFMGTHSVRVSSMAAKNSAMNKILAEPEMKAFLQKPVAAAQEILDAAIKGSEIEGAESGRISLADMLSGAGDGPPIGQMFFALTHIELPPSGAEGAAAMPDVGLVVGVELLEANDLALVKALWAKIPAPEEAGSHEGREYFHKSGEEGWSVSLAFLGNLAVVSTSDTALFDVMARFDGKAGDKGSLAATAEYAKLLSTGGGLVPGASTAFIRVGPLVAIGKAALMQGLKQEASLADKLPKIEAAIDGLGFEALHWLGTLSSRNAEGKVLSTMAVSLDTGRKGLIPQLAGATQPIDTGRLAKVPGNSIGASINTLHGLVEIYDYAMSTFESLDPESHAEVMAMVKQFMGESDLRNDLLANVHGTLLSFSVPGENMAGTPSGVMRVGLRDADAFARALKALVAGANSTFLAGQEIDLTESDHEGRRFFELDISRVGMAAMLMLQPAFAFDGGELVACFDSAKTLKSELNGSAGEGSITENAAFMAFVEQLKKAGAVNSVSFSNNASTFAAVYGQLAGVMPLLGGLGGELPVDLSLMPTESAITKHLKESYAGGYRDPDGKTFVSRSLSQFQVGDFLPLVLTAGALAMGGIQGGGTAQARETSPEERVQEDLAQISAGMTVFKISEGRLPDTIDDLVKPLPNYPEGCLARSEAPVDPWGNPYRFRLNEKKKPVLWSTGPDGIDQQGTGDDILKQK
jgi:hypothetical protein